VKTEAIQPEIGAAPTVPLDRAILCLDCETIYSQGECPKCGSRAGWLMSWWLGGKVGVALQEKRD